MVIKDMNLRELADAIEDDLASFVLISDNPEKINAVVDLLSTKYNWMADENDLFIFKGHSYRKVPDRSFREFFRCCWSKIWPDYTTTRGREAYTQMMDRHRVDPIEINNYPQYIPFLNGLYDIALGKLVPGDPSVYITNPFRIKLEDGDCQLFKYMLMKMVPDEKERNKLLCYLAYCFTSSIKYQLALLLLGPPKTGKTSLTEFFAQLFGENCSAIPFSDFAKDKGAKCGLKGKRLNISSEIGGSKLNKYAIDRIKAMITDMIQNGRDAYRQREQWWNITHFIFCSNNLPSAYHADNAFFRRFIVVEMTERIEDVDSDLYSDLLKYEAPQIVAYILNHLPIMQEYLQSDPEEIESIWNQYSNSIQNL